jgi:methylated-DNA-[protein]-cysteine S-methyltransferase
MTEFAIFQTAIGSCGIVWGTRGVVGIQLPERDERGTRARITRRFPGAHEAEPSATIAQTISAIVALLKGQPCDLFGVTLDMDGVPEFHRRVYDIARTIPAGAIMTYGDIALRLGDRALAREVGQALGKNPFPIIVPCHRVLAAHGKSGGFSAPGGVSTKMRMLSIERARMSDQPMLFDQLALATRRR